MADAVGTVAVVEELAISFVALLEFCNSAVRPDLVALVWLLGRELGDYTRLCWDWLVVVGCMPYYNLDISLSTYMLVLSPLKYPWFVG